MNFLAHALLAGPAPGVLTGSLIADYVKGPSTSQFPASVRIGISLHRRVDAYTDRHPAVLESVSRIRDYTRHYSGVVIDILYDHFLANDFDRHAGTSLMDFVADVERSFMAVKRDMPELVRPQWNTTRWLADYAMIEGLERSFNRVSQRTRGRFDPAAALAALAEHDSALANDFDRFFPELQQFAAEELELLIAESAAD